MKNRLFILALVISLISIPLLAKGRQLTCSGSTTVLPIAQATAEAFMDLHPEVNISVRGGGSGVGIAALQNGTVQIANSSRPMKAKEITQARSKGINPTPYAIALDGIAIVVNDKNPVKNLTIAQIKDIYTGKIKDWSQVGGARLPIVVVSRDVASGTFEVFNEKALSGSKVISSAQLLASNNAVASTVGNTPGAIGYIGLGYLTKDVKLVSVNGTMPSEKTVKDNTYKLSRKLYMYTNGKAAGDVNRYISFIQSAAGQKIVKDQGFVTLN
ncbi:MAG TPA: phosphate ABC transporter substrate-binding protein [Candidatus Cloacimonadota bacterium]|nr:phosphate ABC transporter substrate-binding protein [Candidatus Cloacimonadota bacterium]HPS39614.1 phosphate ABC transporter substrate-binding protein [Candidatus Cloacimonadota bacterium]